MVRLIREHGISQIPVVSEDGRPRSIVHEVDLLRALHGGGIETTSPTREVARPIGGLIHPKARIEELIHIFETDHAAIVLDADRIVGIISKIDLIEHLSKVGPPFSEDGRAR